jgi:pimeloyl-ACP methyl ester carboxylesterase
MVRLASCWRTSCTRFDEDQAGPLAHDSVPESGDHPRNDLKFPPRCGRDAAAAMPKGEFLEVPGVAHAQVAEASEQVRNAVREFFART